MEFHHKINKDQASLSQMKIILGSFPTWALTYEDKRNDELKLQKTLEREENGDILFFYGSSTNRFWSWYKTFVDNTINTSDIDCIQESLSINAIGITDMIFSCERKLKSALDKHLTNRTYNHSFFSYPNKGETLKILCTSKGVLNDMLLNYRFYKNHPTIKINQSLSERRQNDILNRINGSCQQVKQPFFKIFETDAGGFIECFATPSPGSPYRKLTDFGMNQGQNEKYLHSYLKEVFNWFNGTIQNTDYKYLSPFDDIDCLSFPKS